MLVSRNMLASIQEKVSTAACIVGRLQEENNKNKEKLESDVKYLKNNLGHYQERYNDTQKSLKSITIKYDKTYNDNVDVRKRLEQLSVKHNAVMNECNETQLKNNILRHNCTNLEQQNQRLELINVMLESDVAKYKKNCTRAQNDTKKLKQKNKEISQSIDTFKAQVTRLEGTIQNISKGNAKWQKDIDRVVKLVNDTDELVLDDPFEFVKAKIKELNAQLKLKDDTIAKLTEKKDKYRKIVKKYLDSSKESTKEVQELQKLKEQNAVLESTVQSLLTEKTHKEDEFIII